MTYTYTQVEKALARVHRVDAGGIEAFRGRLQHYRKIGLSVASPGKGRRIAYEREDVHFWAFCLQLSAFGLDPTVIVRFVSLAWPSLKEDIVEGGSEAAAERRAHIHRMREAWKPPAAHKPAPSKPETRYFWFQPQLLGKWPDMDAGPNAFQKIDGSDLKSNLDLFVRNHCALINLTRLHEEVEAALVSVSGRDNPGNDFADGRAR